MRHPHPTALHPHRSPRIARLQIALLRLDQHELLALVVLAAAALIFFAPLFIPLAAQVVERKEEPNPLPSGSPSPPAAPARG